MRLIGVAAGSRQLCTARDLVASQQADRVIEPQDARGQLEWHAELAPETQGVMLPTQPSSLANEATPRRPALACSGCRAQIKL